MRILIVEDEHRLAATLQDLLSLNNYTADICHNGEEGLDNALSDIYDLVILDVMLPRMDGFTVLRRMR
jgi:DNA-binding response OmpR family regulator